MDDADITGRQFIDEAEDEQTELSTLPLFDPHIFRYVDNVVAPKWANEFHEDPEDIAQDFWLKVCEAGSTLKDIQHPKAYVYIAVRNRGFNRKRHTKREDQCTESLEWSDGHSKEKLDQREIFPCCSTALNPEEKLLQKEKRAQLRDRIMGIVNTLPPDQARVVLERLKGVPVSEIAKKIEKPLSTTYRWGEKTKSIQKRIVKELGIEEFLKAYPELWICLLDLIAVTLEEPTSLAA